MSGKRPTLLLLLLACFSAVAYGGGPHNQQPLPTSPLGVTYDSKSLLINGKRELLLVGSIHYPRSTPDMWEDILIKAKTGGLNAITTYVFWNLHEPVEGQFNWEGQYDLVGFIKLIQKHDMFVILRLGPFIQAEWNHGGLPYWLRKIPDITFRTDNGPWKKYMERFTKMICDKMKAEKLFASQGGPIILAQIENEYNTIQPAFEEAGLNYVRWAGKMAVGMNIGVPWIMCKQNFTINEIINTCNGRHCGDTWVGPNSPTKPYLWTENWTAQLRVWGDPPSQRAAEDIAYSVARFFSKSGTMVNYYMYHGGTNFGRTSSHFTTTRYYDEAPLDEYALCKEPKWSHLRDLHRALNLCKKALLWGEFNFQSLSPHTEVRWFEQPGKPICAAFLTNNMTTAGQTVKFRGREYFLPPKSISILPDCKTVVYNTQLIVAQHNARSFVKSEIANKNLAWEMYKETIPTKFETKHQEPLELYDLTQDLSDYAWYSSEIDLTARDLPRQNERLPVLRVASLGHGLHAWVNDEYVGHGHGSKVEKSFVFENPARLKAGANRVLLLAYAIGFADSGPYMEKRYVGPRSISFLGLNTGTLDLTVNGWGHQRGLEGEKLEVFSEKGAKEVKWTKAQGPSSALTWFKAEFENPEGNNPVAINMGGMGKGIIWINGRSIGRYWASFLSPLQRPTQDEYHIPRSYLKPGKNLIVVLEEEIDKDPKGIQFVLVNRDVICSKITARHPPSVKLFERSSGDIRAMKESEGMKAAATLTCPVSKKVIAVEFASLGDPLGFCGAFAPGNCNSPVSKQVVEKNCLGQSSCSVPYDLGLFQMKEENCPGVEMELAIQLRCA